jgi:hypothetical protein
LGPRAPAAGVLAAVLTIGALGAAAAAVALAPSPAAALPFITRVSILLFAFAFASEGVARLRGWSAPAAIACAVVHFLGLALGVAPPGPILHLAFALLAVLALCEITGRPRGRLLRAAQAGTSWLITCALALALLGPGAGRWMLGVLGCAAVLRLGWRFVEFTRLVRSEH